MISGFRREVHMICALLKYYAEYVGNDVSGTASETWVRNSHNTLRKIPEKHRPQEELNSQATDRNKIFVNMLHLMGCNPPAVRRTYFDTF
jgi:hypothetical protein